VCGSDWPVALLNGTYERVWRETRVAVARACHDPERILELNAVDLYQLAGLSIACTPDQQ
jgi:predicted TIM-barrel fold metal-dependent hydrolase